MTGETQTRSRIDH